MKRWLLVSLAAVLAAYGQKIETQKPDRTRITRVETALNHLTVIEVGDPVEQVAAGSASYKVEWRGNKVFVQPLEPDAETNLFIWTRSGTRLSYELAPAGTVEKMHFAIDHEPVATAAATPLEAAPRAAAEKPAIPSEMLYKSVPVQFAGAPGGKPKVAVEVRDLYEKDGKVYLRYAIRNNGQSAYQPGAPVVYTLEEPRARVSLISLRRTQLGASFASQVAAKSIEELKVVHSQLGTSVVEPGGETVGLLAFDKPQTIGVTVLRLMFAADRNEEVIATLVL
ncbi:MAG: TrbG/VirB9 family P-type conjugative transfer protein [Bryobacterales bacterium]|nr:TrbG/VirB9 family P-type conjugative transfer protein [Bryobacterales bacterium]